MSPCISLKTNPLLSSPFHLGADLQCFCLSSYYLIYCHWPVDLKDPSTTHMLEVHVPGLRAIHRAEQQSC